MKAGTMEFEMARASTVRIDERNLQIRLPFYGRTKTPEVALAKLRASKAS
jgi:hypothetical protein